MPKFSLIVENVALNTIGSFIVKSTELSQQATGASLLMLQLSNNTSPYKVIYLQEPV